MREPDHLYCDCAGRRARSRHAIGFSIEIALWSILVFTWAASAGLITWAPGPAPDRDAASEWAELSWRSTFSYDERSCVSARYDDRGNTESYVYGSTYRCGVPSNPDELGNFFSPGQLYNLRNSWTVDIESFEDDGSARICHDFVDPSYYVEIDGVGTWGRAMGARSVPRVALTSGLGAFRVSDPSRTKSITIYEPLFNRSCLVVQERGAEGHGEAHVGRPAERVAYK